MIILAWILAIYSVAASVVIGLIQKRRTKDWQLAEELSRMSVDLNPRDKLKALETVLKVQDQQWLWFERSLSTIGVVAFLSMLIATGAQAYRSSVDAAQADQLRKELAALERQRSEVENLVSSMSYSIIAQYRETGLLDRPARKVLRHRLIQLEGAEKPSSEEMIQMFEISLLLQDFDAAKRALDRNQRLVENATPENLLNLAEYDYVVGARKSAVEIADDLESKRGLLHLPKPWQVRLIVLSAVLHGDADKYAGELSAVRGIGSTEAKKVLTSEMERLERIPPSSRSEED